jgi:serine palmitoyltransferase
MWWTRYAYHNHEFVHYGAMLILCLLLQCLANGVLITRLKCLDDNFEPKQKVPAALKVCVTIGLTKKEIEKSGTIIRHAITKVLSRRK